MYRRVLAIGLAAATIAMAAAPAAAAPSRADGMEMIENYFVARDLGWLRPTLRLNRVAAAPAAQRQVDGLARIANELASDNGLVATDVQTDVKETGIADCASGRGYQVDVRTRIEWTTKDIDYSAMTDTFKVCFGASVIQSVEVVEPPSEHSGGPTPTELGIRPASTEKQLPVELTPPTRVLTGVNVEEYTYDRNKAAAYAKKWAEKQNPDFPDVGNNCANFVSQSAYAGGWPERDGIDQSSYENWTWDLWGLRGPSKTWSQSDWLYTFAGTKTARAWPLGIATVQNDWNSVWNLKTGDMIMVDWDPNGKADGTIDHSMFVSSVVSTDGFKEPAISQHTSFRKDVPISAMIKLAASQGRTVMKFYPLVAIDKFKE